MPIFVINFVFRFSVRVSKVLSFAYSVVVLPVSCILPPPMFRVEVKVKCPTIYCGLRCLYCAQCNARLTDWHKSTTRIPTILLTSDNSIANVGTVAAWATCKPWLNYFLVATYGWSFLWRGLEYFGGLQLRVLYVGTRRLRSAAEGSKYALSTVVNIRK